MIQQTEESQQREKDKSYRELAEMREIFAASRMGSWSIYLIEGKAPTMVPDDLMLELLGLKAGQLTPEEIYEAWFSNIVPSSVQSVIDSVEKMKKIGRDENTYLWKHPVLGERYVRCGGTAKQMEGGYVLRGYHYDVDDAMRERKKKDQALEEQVAIINTLSKSFRNVFLASLRDGTARVIRLADTYKVKVIRDVEGQSFPFDAVIKRWIQENVHPEDKERIEKTLNIENVRRELSERDACTGTYRNIEEGVLHNYQYDIRRIEGTDNVVVGFQIIDAIVEEHRKQEQKQREQKEQLAQALAAAQQANRAKSTFLSSVSHDIRTPMNAIIGFTNLAQTNIDDREKVQDYLAKISASSAHLLSLINDILDMSRIESGVVSLEEKPVHLPALFQNLRMMMQDQVNEKNLSLCIDIKNVKNENVIADELRLHQILLNIVSNAVKFTRPGGEILIRLAEKPCDTMQYGVYELSVKDNGIGMSREFQEHIFETFTREYSTTVSGIQGTGLGMAIAKNIVDMMGGEICVESEEGKGTLFTVILSLRIAGKEAKEPEEDAAGDRRDNDAQPESVPTDGAQPKSAQPESVPFDGAQPKSAQPESTLSDGAQNYEKQERKQYDYRGKRTLLVEDNALNREIATALLEETGMQVDCVWDGDVAVKTIRESPAGLYDLILMDVQMPRMDGYTATREIRALPDEEKSGIPIVAMTANAFEEDKQKAYAAGMNGHIIKPISMDSIAKVLDRIFFEQSG